MNTSLQELTDKIYAEGVEKGKAQAQEIVAEAEREAAEIVARAEAEAKTKIAQAEHRATELDKNTRSELKLFAAQAVSALKTEITDILCDKLVQDSVKVATADAAFMQKIIASLAEQLVQKGEVVIETGDAEALNGYFAQNAKGLLEKGVTVKEVKGIKTEFAIAPKEGGYKLVFGDKELVEYFKEFLRPQLVEMLF